MKFPWNLYEMPQLRKTKKRYIHLSNLAKYMWNNISLFFLNWACWIYCSCPEVPVFNESFQGLLVIPHLLYNTHMPAVRGHESSCWQKPGKNWLNISFSNSTARLLSTAIGSYMRTRCWVMGITTKLAKSSMRAVPDPNYRIN